MRPSPRIHIRAPRTLALATVAAIGVSGDLARAQDPAVVIPAGVVRPVAALAGASLFVTPSSPARRQAAAWRVKRPDDAALMEHIASQPTATWLGEWSAVGAAVKAVIGAARTSAPGGIPVFVAYNIPHRDCGGHSAGGAAGAGAYRRWIRELARALAGAPSVVILEPDALAGIDCLTSRAREERLALIRGAVQTLKAAGAAVYIDAGHARWHPANRIGAHLAEAGIAEADGFTLNVSNFVATDASIAYGDSISRLTGGKRYIIDTSRNGAGGTADHQWCNPQGRALGTAPTTATGHALLDAFLWIKVPGESDGSCNGGPRAGAWWPDYALGLAQRHYAIAADVAVAEIAAANFAAANRAAASMLVMTRVATGGFTSGLPALGALERGVAESVAAANASALTALGSLIERAAAVALEHCGHP